MQTLPPSGDGAFVRDCARTILYEDTGLGDPLLCDINRTTSAKNAPQAVLEHLLVKARRTKKSRIQTGFWQTLTHSEELDKAVRNARGRPPERIFRAAADGRASYLESMGFAFSIGGAVDGCRRDAHRMREVLNMVDLRDVARNVCLGAVNNEHPFWAAMMRVFPLYSGACKERAAEWLRKLKIEYSKGMLLEALDQYSRRGRRSMAYLAKYCPRMFRHEDDSKITVDMYKHDLFRTESSWLSGRISCRA